jgi:hypothetical protein
MPGANEKERTMVKASLLTAAGAAVMLAATPVLAQTSTNTMDNPPTSDQSAAPATPDTGMGHTSGRAHRSTHHSATGRQRGGDSQNAEVDRLNQQSFEAAQRGQAFGSTGSGSMSAPPGTSGGMNDMSGGSMGGSGGGGDMGGGPAGPPPTGSGGGRM